MTFLLPDTKAPWFRWDGNDSRSANERKLHNGRNGGISAANFLVCESKQQETAAYALCGNGDRPDSRKGDEPYNHNGWRYSSCYPWKPTLHLLKVNRREKYMYALAKLQYVIHVPMKHKKEMFRNYLVKWGRGWVAVALWEQFLGYLYKAVNIFPTKLPEKKLLVFCSLAKWGFKANKPSDYGTWKKTYMNDPVNFVQIVNAVPFFFFVL